MRKALLLSTIAGALALGTATPASATQVRPCSPPQVGVVATGPWGEATVCLNRP